MAMSHLQCKDLWDAKDHKDPEWLVCTAVVASNFPTPLCKTYCKVTWSPTIWIWKGKNYQPIFKYPWFHILYHTVTKKKHGFSSFSACGPHAVFTVPKWGSNTWITRSAQKDQKAAVHDGCTRWPIEIDDFPSINTSIYFGDVPWRTVK